MVTPHPSHRSRNGTRQTIRRLMAMAKTPLTIRNDTHLAAAFDRVEELAGCVRDSEEEKELEAIARNVAAYTDALKVFCLFDPPLRDDRAGLKER